MSANKSAESINPAPQQQLQPIEASSSNSNQPPPPSSTASPTASSVSITANDTIKTENKLDKCDNKKAGNKAFRDINFLLDLYVDACCFGDVVQASQPLTVSMNKVAITSE